MKEAGVRYYNKLYAAGYNTDRYRYIYKTAAKLCEGRVLDCGCGTARMGRYLRYYAGFDFSREAIRRAEAPHVYQCNLYDKRCYIAAGTYLFLEVFEHINPLRALKNVSAGATIVFSVPSFLCPGHLRAYSEQSIRELPIDIQKVIRFNWHNKWLDNKPNTEDYILLCKGVKKNGR